MPTTDHRPYRAKQLYPQNPIWHLMRDNDTCAATFWGRDSDTEARLAARAMNVLPDLLAACEDMLAVLTEPGIMDVDEWKAGKKLAEAKAVAAIAKATEVDDD